MIKTITKEVAYCDICGKNLSKKEVEQCVPWATLHYGRMYNGKNCTEESEEFSIKLDLCNFCNDKLSDIILEEWDKFTEKFKNIEELKKKIPLAKDR